MTPDFLVIGHIVKDITATGWSPGGSVLYAACQAQRLGLDVAAVTRCAGDIEPASVLPGIDWRVLPGETTTTFENQYRDGHRRQRIPAIAAPIVFSDIPEEWLAAPIVLLAPVFHDVDPKLPSRIAAEKALLGLSAQGWLRRLEGDRVRPGHFSAQPAWLSGDALFMSDEDIEEPDCVGDWHNRVPIVVLTRGRQGSTIWDLTGRHDVPAIATREVDPTGAGDLFAAAFLIRVREGANTLDAAHFASAAAALAVQKPGLDSIRGREEIEARMLSSQAVGA